jgi:hypothetical protein
MLKAWLGPKGIKRYLAHPMVNRVAVVATFHYVCFTMHFFEQDLEQTYNAFATIVSRLI